MLGPVAIHLKPRSPRQPVQRAGPICDHGQSDQICPAMPADPPAPIDRLRTICLSLPQAEERETWDIPTFRVRDKIFAMAHDWNGRPSVWFKAPAGVQALLTEAAPDRFFRPPYVGHKGWVGLWLDAPWDQAEAEALITRSWRMTAPKRLSATLEDPDVSSPGDTHDAPSRRRSLPSRTGSNRRKAASTR